MMAALLRNKKPAPKKAESPVSISGIKAAASPLEKDKLSMTVPSTGSANAKDFVSAFDASLTVGHPMRKTRSNNNMNNKESGIAISPAPASSWPDMDKDKDVDMVAKEKTDGDYGFGYWGQPQKQESVEARPETLITSDSEMTVAMPNLYRGISTVKPDAPIKKLIAKRKTLLMPQRKQDEGKLTVVLDLDETLIHSEFTGQDRFRQAEADRMHASGRRKPDFSITLYENDPNQEEEVVHVYKRPGLENFLKKLSEICEPVIFTAALPMYARPILKQIDPKRRCKSRLYRNATVQFRGYPHVKSLKNLGRDLGRVIIVDNSPYAMCADPDSAIPIKAYYDDLEDRELEYLYEIIAEMVQMADVRPHLRRKFAFAQTLAQIMDSA